MAEPRPHFTVDDVGETTLIRFLDSQISHPSEIAAIRERLYDLVTEGRTRLVLGFVGVELIVTEMLGVLIGLKRKVEAAGGQLHLFGFQPLPRETFRITALDQIFAIHDDEPSALAAIG